MLKYQCKRSVSRYDIATYYINILRKHTYSWSNYKWQAVFYECVDMEHLPNDTKPIPSWKVKYFGFLSDSDEIVKITLDEAICELCNERIKQSNNAPNLLIHLKWHHSIGLWWNNFWNKKWGSSGKPSVSRIVKNTTSSTKTKQQSLLDINSKKEPCKKNSPRYQAGQNALVFFMCTIYNQSAFCQLLHTLE